MEKIKLDLFDLFSYILPGSFLLLSIYWIINAPTDLVEFLISTTSKMNFATAMITIIACYICGFLGQYLGYEVFKVVSQLIWKKRMTGETSFGKMENEIVQIRHFSPNNFIALHKWLAVRGMCYGMFQSLILFEIIFLIRSIQLKTWTDQRIVILIVIIILAILFLRRAVTFHEWAKRTIKYSMENMKAFKN
jgi:hypothetical protein